MSGQKYKYADIAKALGVKRAYITVNIQRENIIPDKKNKLIDIELAENKLWIDSQIAKGKTFDLSLIEKEEIAPPPPQKEKRKPGRPPKPKPELEPIEKKKPGRKPKPKEPEKTIEKRKPGRPPKDRSKEPVQKKPIIDPYAEKMRDLKYQEQVLSLQKEKNEAHLKQIEIDKKMGTLIPVDAAKKIFIYAVETFRTLYTQDSLSMASIMAERFEVDDRTYKEIQKELSDRINDTLKDVKETLIKNIGTIVDEYKEVRGRGEKR